MNFEVNILVVFGDLIGRSRVDIMVSYQSQMSRKTTCSNRLINRRDGKI